MIYLQTGNYAGKEKKAFKEWCRRQHKVGIFTNVRPHVPIEEAEEAKGIAMLVEKVN